MRLAMLLCLSLLLPCCVRSGDGAVDITATLRRGARIVCAAVEALPDAPPPASASERLEAPDAGAVVIRRDMDAGR